MANQHYQYQYGDRPLEGYTIQRGVGRGGFGEVYYAVSDSGRQVALKAIQTYEQIELRGVNQCMNLKSPHLVTIFDVRYNDKGRPFVIMEYVSGPSLADMIKESPGGLGPQKAAFFLREIAKGLSYLHDCGIVHRDLKPGNVFYEDGRVKIGDYGLSKAINTSQCTGQTITVGTVHYMAPEIGEGRYDRSIDIYALGILLYEMLTGQVPFFGNSPAEVLMKHMTAQPDLTHVDETFARVIRKALEKDPAKRYRTVQEMVEDVFGCEHVRNSVSQFSPESLSIVAARIAAKVKPTPGPQQGSAGAAPQPQCAKPQQQSTGPDVGKLSPEQAAAADTLTKAQRNKLSIIAAGVIAIGVGFFASGSAGPWHKAAGAYAMIVVCAQIIVHSRSQWMLNLEAESAWLRRLATAAIVALPLAGLCLAFGNRPGVVDKGTWLAIVIPLALTDWWKLSTPMRANRVSVQHALGLALLGFIVASFVDGSISVVIGVLAGTSLAVQTLSPYYRSATDEARTEKRGPQAVVPPPAPARPAPPSPVPAPAAAVPPARAEDVSPHTRLLALILAGCALFGFNGLHRFYVGKIWTGLLWFFTAGLLGVGQIIDIILILCSSFRDKDGRLILNWENETGPANQPAAPPVASPLVQPVPANPPQPVPAAAPPPAVPIPPSLSPTQTVVIREPIDIRGGIFGFVGGLLVLAAVVVGLFAALRGPSVVAAGFPDPSIGQRLTEVFGIGWAGSLQSLGLPIMVILLAIATTLLIIARRRHGAGHILRAVFGAMCLFLMLILLMETFADVDAGRIAYLLQAKQIGPLLEMVADRLRGVELYISLGLFVFTAVILNWPPRRRHNELNAILNHGVN